MQSLCWLFTREVSSGHEPGWESLLGCLLLTEKLCEGEAAAQAGVKLSSVLLSVPELTLDMRQCPLLSSSYRDQDSGDELLKSNF